MSSPSQLDKEDEDYEPIEEEDDEDYKPGKKRKSKRKKKQPPKSVAQKSSSQFQFVAEIPIEFDIAPSSNNEDSSENLTDAPSSTANAQPVEQEPPKKKPRKMITPQRSRTDPNRKSFINPPPPPPVNNPNNNGTAEKDPLALTDSANNIPKVAVNNAVNRYPCGFCDTVFTDISFLERHHKRCKTKRTAESISLAQQIPINITKPATSYMQLPTGRFMYSCEKCSFTTKNPEHLKYHRPIHNDEQYFSCDQCKFSCRVIEQFNAHKQLHSGNNMNVNLLQISSLPQSEGSNGDSQQESKNDDQKAPDVKPVLPIIIQPDSSNDKQEESGVTYTCDQCTYTTSRQGYLVMHKKIHVRDQPYQCKDCGYKCSRLAYFKKHRATHGVTDDTLVSCDRCSFTTSSQVVLDAHKQCHKV